MSMKKILILVALILGMLPSLVSAEGGTGPGGGLCQVTSQC
jgi:hypothetical protein